MQHIVASTVTGTTECNI